MPQTWHTPRCPEHRRRLAVKRSSLAWLALVLAGAASVLVATAEARPTPAQKCQAGKNKAAGTYAACRQDAEAMLVATGNTTRYAKATLDCSYRFAAKWLQLDARAARAGATCPDTPLGQSAMAATIDECTMIVGAALAGGGLSNCAADLAACQSTLAACEAMPPTPTPTPTPVCTPHSQGTGTDNCDGTVTDLATGLQWEKKVATVCGGGPNTGDTCFADSDCPGGSCPSGDPHDAGNVYSWAGCCNGDCTNYCQPNAAAATTCAAEADGGTLGCSVCASGTCIVDPDSERALTTVWDWLNQVNVANFAGHSDWRLPSEAGCNSCYRIIFGGGSCPCSPNELETGFLDEPILGPRAAYGYWSATTDTGYPTNAWSVDIFHADVDDVGASSKGNAGGVRAVRTGP